MKKCINPPYTASAIYGTHHLKGVFISNKTVYTPQDVDYTFSGSIEINAQTGFRQTVHGKTNAATAIYQAPPPPQNIPADHNRLTVAMDVGFWGDCLNLWHLVLAVRLKTKDYQNKGDLRCGAAALGKWTAQHGFPDVIRGAAIEEPQISDQKNNQFHHPVSNCLTENKRYRLTLDSILFNGHMAHELRIKDHTTGSPVYATPRTFFSSYKNNYNTQSRLIMIATLAPEGVPTGGSYSNLVSYWTLATDWIPDP